MEHQNIIMVCQQNWDLSIGSNAKNLAREFAKHNQVLYVNMPLDVNSALRNRHNPEVKNKLRVLLGQAEGLVQAEPNVWVFTPSVVCLSINWLASLPLFSTLNRFNSRLFANSIQKAAGRLGFTDFYLFQDGIIFQALDLKEMLKPLKFIYYVRDYMLTVPYFQRHGPWVEAASLRQADVVAANSAYLNDYARTHNPEHSHDIGQGCVLSLYQADADYLMPADLADIPRPLVGYTGFLTGLRLDLDLLLAIARRQPNWNLVLVGPEDEAFAQSPLHSLPNVFFLGRKAPEELPAYLSQFDVCINPQLVNEVTVGNYPLKIDEYLAMGKPVVATYTRTMELFQHHVALARNEDEWLAFIAQALADGDDETQAQARIAFAQSHTWEASVKLLYDAVEAVSQPEAHCLAD
jgi:glycosyltransferase involved in cell wall biosynthesis